jgi:nucleotide-binding universal stress UspA family protein
MKQATNPRALACLALVGAAAALGAACGPDDAGAGEAEGTQRLAYVIEPSDQTVTLVDNPGKRVAHSKETPGDMAVQEAILRDAEGQRAGEIYATFTTVGKPGIEAVSATLDLSDGDLIAQGMIGNGAEDELGVVGGTGVYSGARGSLRVTQDEDVVRLEVELERR